MEYRLSAGQSLKCCYFFEKKNPQTQGGENLGLDQCKVFTSLIAEMFE